MKNNNVFSTYFKFISAFVYNTYSDKLLTTNCAYIYVHMQTRGGSRWRIGVAHTKNAIVNKVMSQNFHFMIANIFNINLEAVGTFLNKKYL